VKFAALSLSFAASLGLAVPAPVAAHGNIQCKAGPKANWKSVDALKSKITAQGWTVRKAKPEKDCYEVYGTTPEGDRVEAFFHPVTLDRVLVLKRGKVLYRAPGV
jgi:hypothetical protein